MSGKADSARSTALAVVDRVQRFRLHQPQEDFDPSLAGGDAGLAVLFGYLARCAPGDGWENVAHAAVLRMSRGLATMRTPPIGMFGGLAGIAFTFWYLSHGDTRYRRARTTVEDILLPRTISLATSLAKRRGMPVEDYDVVSGVCGVAAYLLCRTDDERALSALALIVAALAEIAERDESPASWFTPAHLISTRSMIGKYPEGALNCGMAHGMPGVLGILSLTHLAGIPTVPLRAAIQRLTHWLLTQRQIRHWGYSWPAAVGVRASDPASPAPVGWCYGNPGVARSLWLAGEALDDAAIRAISVEALRSAYRRPGLQRSTLSPTFCHGIAGLLHITMRFATETALPDFAVAAQGTLDRLLALYSEDVPLGYRDHDSDIGWVDRCGLLEGAAGVALVLLAASSRQPPGWDRLFVIS